MVAGVGGMDLVMLHVAADESVMPQTREHFEICRLLQVPAGLVVITKSDLADEDMLDVVRAEVRELVAGSFLEALRSSSCRRGRVKAFRSCVERSPRWRPVCGGDGRRDRRGCRSTGYSR